MKKNDHKGAAVYALSLVVCAFAAVLPLHAAVTREEGIAKRLESVGVVQYGEAAKQTASGAVGRLDAMQAQGATPQPAVAARPGEATYKAHCMVCHASGVAGAPKLGDKAGWEKRVAQGEATLLKHALEGYNAMPARGACPDCSDDDIKQSIDYMLEHLKS